jgi:hypothetical protein
VSHQPERLEKDCLNCGTLVAGRYCQFCGQENIPGHQTAWGMVKHFIYDIFHFDGKFFDTLNRLLFRPGFVPLEYSRGRRVRYLDPIRMYLFTSALFFLVFFAMTDPASVIKSDTGRILGKQDRFTIASSIQEQIENGNPDSSHRNRLALLLDTTYRAQLADAQSRPTTDSVFPVQLNGQTYHLVMRKAIPEQETFQIGDSWFSRKVDEKLKNIRARHGDDSQAIMKDLGGKLLHQLPYVLFVSLPFFALILQLLYLRRKKYFYSDHAVFTLYHYIFSFLLLLVLFMIGALRDWLEWKVFSYFIILLLIMGGVYLFLSMRRFYQQGWWRTMFKFLMLNFLGMVLLIILFIIFFFLSIFQL